MDKNEARRVLKEELSKYKKRSYADLLKIADEPETYELTTESGNWYQIEIVVLSHDKLNGNLAILGNIDDGCFHAFFPLSAGFDMTQDGKVLEGDSEES